MAYGNIKTVYENVKNKEKDEEEKLFKDKNINDIFNKASSTVKKAAGDTENNNKEKANGEVYYDTDGKMRVSGEGEDSAAYAHAGNRDKSNTTKGEENYRTMEFEYDLNEDPLYQQYLESAKRNGKSAMTDTIAKTAAQTGGIAGSYAVAAGAESYNDYMEELNDVIPELEQLAYDKYQDELERNFQIAEMDEEDKWEEGELNSILQKAQDYGADSLTSDERETLYSSGEYWIADGSVYGPEGELASENRGFTSAYDNYDAYGWENISEEDKDILNANGFRYNAETGRLEKGGAEYPWRGEESTDELVARYKAGEELTASEKMRIEDSGEYVFKNGLLYKDGKIVEKSYMQYDELQLAYNDYESNGWDEMEPENQLVLQEYGYDYDDLSGMIFDEKGYYRWGGSTPYDRAMTNYLAGNELEEDDILLLINNGYDYENGTLYYDGTAITKTYSGEETGDLSAAMSAVIISNQSGRALSNKYIDILADYGFQYNDSKNEWIQKDTGVSLFDY